MVDGLPQRPDLVLFTGDLTHDIEDKDVHAQRMKQFQEISKKMNVPLIKHVPGEHDAGLDGGVLYREVFGESHYSFDHRGVHFVALDNVSRAKPEVGTEQLAWLKKDLARFSKSAPIVIFAHRPLFDLRPDWECFTSDDDDVMNVLADFDYVTVLYGHIHRDDEHETGKVHHYAALSDLCLSRSNWSSWSAEAGPVRQGSSFQEPRHSHGCFQRGTTARLTDALGRGYRTHRSRVPWDQRRSAAFEKSEGVDGLATNADKQHRQREDLCFKQNERKRHSSLHYESSQD